MTLAQRDSHRAEFYADALAARVAGSAALLEVLDLLLLDESVLTVLRRHGRASGTDVPDPPAWREPADGVRRRGAGELPRLAAEELRRATSPFAEHPPLALPRRVPAPSPPLALPRRVLTASAPVAAGPADEAPEVDADLAFAYRRLARDLRSG